MSSIAFCNMGISNIYPCLVSAEKATIGEEEIGASLNVTQGVGLAEILSGIHSISFAPHGLGKPKVR